jgi:Flp pilus assembly protein CpaB
LTGRPDSHIVPAPAAFRSRAGSPIRTFAGGLAATLYAVFLSVYADHFGWDTRRYAPETNGEIWLRRRLMAAGALCHHGHHLRMGFCVGTVALLLAVLLDSRDALAPGNQTAGTLVVAKVPIPFGAKITPEQLELAPIPNGPAPEGAFDSPDKVAGRVAVIPIGVREPVTDFKLAAEGTVGGLKAVIPEGYRAMTVHVGEVVGGSGLIMPGSFVDVMCVITPPGGWRRGPISKIVLQNIKVLANNQNLDCAGSLSLCDSNSRTRLLPISQTLAKAPGKNVGGLVRPLLRGTSFASDSTV